MAPKNSDNVRLVKDDGNASVITFMDAKEIANDLELDLICIAENADPPVYKIMDRGKYEYEQKKKQKELKKKQKQSKIQTKEIKFRTRIESHDFNTKENMIKKFLGEGKNVKVTILVRGRELTHPEIPRQIADKVIKESEDFVANSPKIKQEGSNIVFTLEPKHR